MLHTQKINQIVKEIVATNYRISRPWEVNFHFTPSPEANLTMVGRRKIISIGIQPDWLDAIYCHGLAKVSARLITHAAPADYNGIIKAAWLSESLKITNGHIWLAPSGPHII